MNRLTQQQQAVFDFIRDCMSTRGYGPTVREIGQHMDIRSPNGVMCHLRALEKKGHIRRSANKSRAIELTQPLQHQDLEIDLSGSITSGVVQLDSLSINRLNLTQTWNAPERFLLTVRDDHLQAHAIRAGDHLLVSKLGTPLAGQLVIAQVSETNEKIVGQVHIEAGRLRVAPLVHPMPATFQSRMNLLGIVVGVFRLFQTTNNPTG
jgi:repressor LexA